MLFFAATIFLSAFLLFQVQPLIAKVILPWFGGTASVWATCMVFFQTVLLLGYLYAHGLTARLKARQQVLVHSVLLALAVLTLPILPGVAWKPADAAHPTARILLLLAVTVGLPYLLLSSTGPLLQAWFVRWRPGASPYRLFALSNLGSMLGLLTYPPLVEPFLALRWQGWTWSAGFITFAGVCAATAWRSLRSEGVAAAEEYPDAADEAPGVRRHAGWALLSMGPSMLLLSLTNHLTQDVASIPFLWVLPLALYLLSFILCFDADGWYRRGWFLWLVGPALVLIAGLMSTEVTERPNLRLLIPLYAAAFFVVCMTCHGELARLRPHPRRLTSYYLMISIGGALGGVMVAVVAPTVFNAYYELPLAIVLCGLLVVLVLVLDRGNIVGGDWLSWRAIAMYVALAGLSGFLTRVMREHVRDNLTIQRNFYGELRVRQSGNPVEWESTRTLVHGTINHGEQYLNPQRRREAATYYCPSSGLGLALTSRPLGTPQHVGIVGLGTGTIAAFGRPGDVYRFYEINPLVQKIANSYFTYLSDSDALIEVALGDARLTLERESPQHFDVLAVDAFSSDAIPIHLLTLEAIQLYFKHLRPDGILAVHVSNRYLNLAPVLERAAIDLGKKVVVIETEESEEGKCFGTTWVLMGSEMGFFSRPEVRKAARAPNAANWLRAWTDDYSNLLQVLK